MDTCYHLNLKEQNNQINSWKCFFFLFSKAQNHLCRESDGHGTRGTSHSYLWSLRRSHPLHHLENFHPKHQQWRKGTMSPKSFRAMECRLEASQVYPRPSSLWHMARWDVVTRSHSRSCNLPPPACLVVVYSTSSHSGMDSFPVWIARGMLVVGLVTLDGLGRRQ